MTDQTCNCLTYGHGLTETRVNRRDCPVHGQGRSRRSYARRVTEAECAPQYADATHGSVYADELADTREAERLKREKAERP